MKNEGKASWEDVAGWYNEYLESTQDSYQRQVILPNILRILDLKQGTRVLDLACGQGFFSRAFSISGAQVVGCDISESLIAHARTKSPREITFHVSTANKLSFAQDREFGVVACILALQNIEDLAGTVAEAWRALAKGGRFVIVLNHPAFRIPKNSSWGWDEKERIQYRRIDRYLSAAALEIDMHPGEEKKHEKTLSFHRSLQDYFKQFSKAGFAVTRLEEWISHKKSEHGARQNAENRSRKEIPLFLMLELKAVRDLF